MTKFIAVLFASLMGLWCCAATDASIGTDSDPFGSIAEALNLPRGLARAVSDHYLRGASQLPPFPPAGWIYGFAYTGPICSGDPDYSVGVITNTCLTPTRTNNTAEKSYSLSCTPASGTVVIYDSLTCDPAAISGQQTIPFVCFQYQGYTVQPLCSVSPTISLDVPYILTESFSDSMCGSTLEYQGWRDGACVVVGGNSKLYRYPNLYYYKGVTDCSGDPTTTTPLGPLDVCQPAEANQPFVFPYTMMDLNATVSTSPSAPL